MDMGRLDGKIAIITGAAQGMGEPHARAFVSEGARVRLIQWVFNHKVSIIKVR